MKRHNDEIKLNTFGDDGLDTVLSIIAVLVCAGLAGFLIYAFLNI
jgi:hypothetical protein